MDGPFTIEQAHTIYGGHFRTCPLGLVEKPGSLALQMIRHLSKEDDYGISTNSWVNLYDFPTHWFTVAQTADFVSPNFYCIFRTYSLNIPFQTMPLLMQCVSGVPLLKISNICCGSCGLVFAFI